MLTVESKSILKYLKEYTVGDAKDCILRYFTLNSEKTYLDAHSTDNKGMAKEAVLLAQ